MFMTIELHFKVGRSQRKVCEDSKALVNASRLIFSVHRNSLWGGWWKHWLVVDVVFVHSAVFALPLRVVTASLWGLFLISWNCPYSRLYYRSTGSAFSEQTQSGYGLLGRLASES